MEQNAVFTLQTDVFSLSSFNTPLLPQSLTIAVLNNLYELPVPIHLYFLILSFCS